MSQVTNDSTEKPERNSWLDVLRGLAALAVTIFHFNEPVPPVDNLYRNVVKWFWLGVPIFFVLSGFVVHSAAIRSRSVSQYAWRRFTRIMPPYWASLAVVFAAVATWKILYGANDRVVFPHELSGWVATFAAMVRPATATVGLSWVYWTLSYELAFYAVTTFAVVQPRWFPLLTIALAILTLAPFETPATSLPGLFFLDQWPLFGLGVSASLAHRRSRTWATLVFATCITAAVTNLGWAASLTACSTVFYIACSGLLPQRIHGGLLRLGDISYSLYLIHVPIGCYLLLAWKTGPWNDEQAWNVAYDAVDAAICLLVAWGFFFAVEQPSMRLGRMQPWRWPSLRVVFARS